MRLCPTCQSSYPDDANFCPMDATKLPEAAPAPAPDENMQTLVDGMGQAIAGRFLCSGSGIETATGRVYEARDIQGDGAACLVELVDTKVLPNTSMADRALRELKQLSKVVSERITRVVDQGRLPDGQVYVATEVVGGQTLEALVLAEPLPLERATAIVLQIGEALAEAQKVGVIHRDVSPGNVRVLPGDKIKISSFGLAQAVPGASGETRDKVFGAPAYLSPEQVEGRPVDQRSNIYSLGAIFHFALTGAPPFAGDTEALLQQQLHAPPSPPSAKKSGLPGEIDRIILKSLEKSGGRRHLTLRQLLGEIEAAGQVKPAAADASARAVMVEAPRVVAPQLHPQPASTAAMTAEAPKLQAPLPTNTGEKKPLQASPEVQAAVAAAKAQVAAQNKAAPAAPVAPMAKGGFRETAWFKAGEIQEELEKAKAKADQAGGDALASTGSLAQHDAIDTGGEVDLNRVHLDAADKARLSLKTGATQMMQAVKMPQAVPGERMNEAEMLAEIDNSKRKFMIAGAIVAAALIAAILFFALGGQAEAPAAGKAAVPSPAPIAVAASSQPAAAPTPVVAVPAPARPDPQPPAESPAQLLAAAQSSAARDNLTQAVDQLTRAVAAGAPAKPVKKIEAALEKQLARNVLVAKKSKDKEALAEAQALRARLTSIRSAKRK